MKFRAILIASISFAVISCIATGFVYGGDDRCKVVAAHGGRLVVSCDDGTQQSFNSGDEITISKKNAQTKSPKPKKD